MVVAAEVALGAGKASAFSNRHREAKLEYRRWYPYDASMFDDTATIIGFWLCCALATLSLAVQHRRYVPGNPSFVPWTTLFVGGFLGAILFGLHWLRLTGTIAQ
jgi:hypothetical protein